MTTESIVETEKKEQKSNAVAHIQSHIDCIEGMSQMDENTVEN